MIKKKVPDAVIEMTNGRTSSFEIEINGVLVYSKLKEGKMPNFEDIVKKVEEAAKKPS
ncbi:migration and invasion enhancer 1-like protein [Leptotrombidium deliense]|uniref:Migration and invasion enhancer 1-like protein n=1 Tax=Leptotrombidium deliense TaxID=299467 RepID=A0A443RWT3_9ACAR|nr:migration and invasion enhancer 1-like protein [Leptotrombidium deliense]